MCTWAAVKLDIHVQIQVQVKLEGADVYKLYLGRPLIYQTSDFDYDK